MWPRIVLVGVSILHFGTPATFSENGHELIMWSLSCNKPYSQFGEMGNSVCKSCPYNSKMWSRAVKKIDKDQFLSISLILSIIDKNFNLLLVIDFLKIHHFFWKKNNFLGRGKNFGGHDHFLEEGVPLH